MKKILLSTLGAVASLFITGCVGPKLAGTFDGQTYTSQARDYTVPMPAMTGAGNKIVGDDARGVSFRDDFGSRVSFYSYPLAARQEALATYRKRGTEKTLREAFAALYGNPAMTYHPGLRGGTMTCVYFKQAEGAPAGVAAFIRSENLYIVEFGYPKATAFLHQNRQSPSDLRERDAWLVQQALEYLRTMQVK